MGNLFQKSGYAQFMLQSVINIMLKKTTKVIQTETTNDRIG